MLLLHEQREQIKRQLAAHQHRNYNVDIDLGPLNLKNFSVHAHVFRPDIMSSSICLARFLVQHKHLYKQKTILDMGCGSGIQGIVTALNGGKQVIFSDVSQKSVTNALENIKNFGLENKCNVFVSDLFEKLLMNFEVIVFNHPFFAEDSVSGYISSSMLARPELLINFLQQAKDHMNSESLLIMPYYHLANLINDPAVQAPKLGYEISDRFNATLNYGLQKGKFSIYLIKLAK